MNIEDDVFVSGRLRAFALHMRCAEETAIGVLCQVWRQTQSQGFIQGSIQDFAQAIRLWLPTYSASEIASAMIQSGLAEAANDDIYIRGNEPHISRLNALRNQAEKMRKKAAKRRGPKELLSQDLKQDLLPVLSQDLKAPEIRVVQEPSLAPYIQRTNDDRGSTGVPAIHTHTESLAALVSEKPTKLVKAKPSASGVFRVRDAFVAGYAELYNGAPYDWDHARDGRQAKKLVGNGDEGRVIAVVAEVNDYFGWKNPEVIREGHTFSHGFQSFVSKRHKLRADHAAPERHDAAAILAQERYEAGKQAFKQKQEQLWAVEHSATSQAAIQGRPVVLAALPSRKSEGS